MARNPRVSREAQTRAATKKPETYTPPDLLPLPVEDGYIFKWKRKTYDRGRITDTRNMARATQQGWVICRPEEYPDIANIINPLGKERDVSTSDYIENGGLILMKIPEETAKGIRLYNIRQARAQVRAVDNNYFSLKDRGVEVFRDPESRTYTDRRG